MAVFTINDDIITSEAAKGYFCQADRRVMIGLRAALEMLGIPVPDYAKRRQPGLPPSRSVQAAYRADHRKPRNYTTAPRKPNASLDAVAQAKARQG